jgi:hypothetical protein
MGVYANQGKLFKKQGKIRVNLELIVVQSLPWPKETCGSKLSLYCNIFLSQNCVQKYIM